MKKQWAAMVCILTVSLYMVPATADEYSNAYDCGIEALSGGAESALSAMVSCIGNSYDPSPLEEKAYADAERDFKSDAIAQAGQCPFEFGIWIAGGSRADNFEEGAQLIDSLSEAASLLGSGRDVFLYDINGNKISATVANPWFVRQGDDVVLTDEARRNCRGK